MSIEQLKKQATDQDIEQNTRDYWKEKADLLGLTYQPNITTEKLKLLVQQKLMDNGGEGTAGRIYTSKLAPEVQRMHEEANKLVRFKIRVLDPSKASWTGMYVTAGNDNLSPVKRAIYFIEQPWHAEQILINILKGMKYAHRPSAHSTRLRGSFNKHDKPKLLPMFHIEELPPLTEEELKDLAQYQAQNNTGQQEE